MVLEETSAVRDVRFGIDDNNIESGRAKQRKNR